MMPKNVFHCAPADVALLEEYTALCSKGSAVANEFAHKKHPCRYALGFAFLLLISTGCESMVAQSHNAEGVQLYRQARYQDALREFQDASYSEPMNADAYYNLAATYHRVGELEHRKCDFEQAESYYNRCLDYNANHTDCYRGLAILLAEEGRNAEAFRLLEGWTQRQPNLPDAKIELARLNDEFGNRQAAKELLLEAVAIQPDNPRALTALGKIREETGEPVQALANYQRSLWYNNGQPQVAARVYALQASGVPSSNGPFEAAPVQMADRPGYRNWQ
jgi:tetratricopeptide (TPR) repeat protein